MNEMSEQVRGIVFVLLVLVVIFVWSHFFTPPVPPAQKQVPFRQSIVLHATGQCGGFGAIA